MSNNSQLDTDFVDFIRGKVKNVKSPMKLMQLCKEFKKKSGTSSSEDKLLGRLQRIRDKMSEMNHIDIDIKVKMIFALGSPVGNGLLIELKKKADVELDKHNRIIEYNKHGKGLQLSGTHISLRRTNNIEMMKFLAEKSKNATSPMTDRAFFREFNSLEGNLKSDDNFNRYNLLKQQIYLTPEFDQETKIRMIFVSNTKAHASVLEELRKNAAVEVDELQRITKYKANDGSLELNGEHQKHGFNPKKEWTKPETEKLEMFIAEKSKKTKEPLNISKLSREFGENSGICRTVKAVKRHIYTDISPNISKLDSLDVETRMKMIFALSAPVEKGFLNKLRKKAVVEVDKYQRITKYKANDGSLKLETKRPLPTVWSKEEHDKLWNFIAEKSKQTKEPLLIDLRPFTTNRVEKNEISRTMYSVRRHISDHLLPKISKLDSFDIETKVRMIFALSVPVEEAFLNELRKEAVVRIDEKRRIIEYTANDGSLELDGDHSVSAKIRTVNAQKKSQSRVSESSENEEETEDDDDEDDEENDVEVEASRSNTIGGRLLKKRCSDNNLFSDSDDSLCESSETVEKSRNKKNEKVTRKRRIIYFSETSDEESEEEKEPETDSSITTSGRISEQRYPDVDFDTPEKLDDSNAENETEDLVAKSSVSSSKAPQVVENPSDTTSSSSKSTQYGRDVDTHNGIETDRGTMQNEGREAIHDGPGEEVEANSSITRSGRISKQRYTDVGFDDVSFGPLENVDDSKVEKNTEKTIEVPSDSSSRTPLVKNRKRKIVENLSVATSSSSKSKKYGRDADTQNDTETDKISNGTMQHDDREAICDGTGEPSCPDESPIKQESFPNKEVKLEDEEIKPDLSFLSNTNQNNMPNFAETEQIRTDDVDQSTESIEEMTSGKEFMKALDGLVHTLDSSVLNELTSKIEKAIKEIGDGDHKVPTDEIARTLQSGLYILNKNAAMKPPTREYTSLRDFISFLRNTLSTFRSPSLNTFQLKLKENAKKLNGQDKFILLDIIGTVLETLFLLVSP